MTDTCVVAFWQGLSMQQDLHASLRATLANTKTLSPQTATNPNGKFSGKVVLIPGQPLASAKEPPFAREGARVFFYGRRENLGRQVEAKIKIWGEVTYMRSDVRQERRGQGICRSLCCKIQQIGCGV